MNDDNVDMNDLDPPEPQEVREVRTIGWIETLRRKRVCLFPGADISPLGAHYTDFVSCLPYLGDCNALIFCEPHDSKEAVRACINKYAGRSRDENGHAINDVALHDVAFNGVKFNCGASVGIENDLIEQDELCFPTQQENLLVWRPQANADPQSMRPPDSRFWAHYAILELKERHEKIHLLHLGLRGDHAWLYFIQPLGIRVARLISHASYR